MPHISIGNHYIFSGGQLRWLPHSDFQLALWTGDLLRQPCNGGFGSCFVDVTHFPTHGSYAGCHIRTFSLRCGQAICFDNLATAVLVVALWTWPTSPPMVSYRSRRVGWAAAVVGVILNEVYSPAAARQHKQKECKIRTNWGTRNNKRELGSVLRRLLS